MKLSIAYRIYPKISKLPPIFADDKLKLSELCLASFVRSLSNVDYKFWAILDGCSDEYLDLFNKYIPSDRLIIIRENSVGNAATFRKQVEILSEQTFSENVYFAEDDYYYLDFPFEKAIGAVDSGRADFLSPYDHLDYYTFPIHNYPQPIENIGGIAYRQVSSTTMTFLTTRRIADECKDLLLTYCKKNYDISMWLVITKLWLYNPMIYVNSGLGLVPSLKILAKILVHTPSRFILGKKYKLIAPKPSLALHMESEKMSPDIDWHKLFSDDIQRLNI